jgi:hypothetical protein
MTNPSFRRIRHRLDNSLHLVKRRLVRAALDRRAPASISRRDAVVPLMLTERGERANAQNEIGPGSWRGQASLCEAPFGPFRQPSQACGEFLTDSYSYRFFSSPWEDENPIQTCTYVRNTRSPRRRGPKIKNRVSPRAHLDRDCWLPRWYRSSLQGPVGEARAEPITARAKNPVARFDRLKSPGPLSDSRTPPQPRWESSRAVAIRFAMPGYHLQPRAALQGAAVRITSK